MSRALMFSLAFVSGVSVLSIEAARGEYDLTVNATVPSRSDTGGGPDSLKVDTQSQLQPKTGVTATASRNISTICYLVDPSLQQSCEVGNQPSLPVHQMLSSGSLLAEAHAELTPSSDPVDSKFTIFTFKASARAAITPTHALNNDAGPSAYARYTGQLFFTGNSCLGGAVRPFMIFRGKSNADKAGNSNALNNRYYASLSPSAAWMEPPNSTDATKTNYIVTTLQFDTAMVGAGSHDFNKDFPGYLSNSPETSDLFKSEGFKTTIELSATASAQGSANENPDYHVEVEATLIGFAFANTAGEILNLPPGTITVTDDAGNQFRVLDFAELNLLFEGLRGPATPCGAPDSPDATGDGSDSGNSDSDGNGCVTSLCGPICPFSAGAGSLIFLSVGMRRRSANRR